MKFGFAGERGCRDHKAEGDLNEHINVECILSVRSEHSVKSIIIL